jgi:hypothetical protein
VASIHQHIERRQHPRYSLREGTYAFLRPPANKIGQIIDISLSGLAFSYFSTNGASPDTKDLDLLAVGGKRLENIPFETVNDSIIPNEIPFSQITMRRKCVKFGNLSTDHMLYIENIIEQYQHPDM